MSEIRLTLVQEASIPALRMVLFLLALFVATSWTRRKYWLALGWLGLWGATGLGYWLFQMVSPLGLGNDVVLTRAWAQSGVNWGGHSASMGFVAGTSPELSLPSVLSLTGLPLSVLHAIPQIAVLLCFFVQLLLPVLLFRNRATGVFAAGLAAGGGLWPGISPYRGVLHNPLGLATAALLLGLLLAALARATTLRKRLQRFTVGIAAGLIGLAAICRALASDAEPDLIVCLLLSTASVLLVSPLRRLRRRLSSPLVSARRAGGLILLGALTGSGLLWWNPVATVPGFVEARDDDRALLEPMKWISAHVPPESVVLASPGYSASIAALAGRRVLFPPPAEAGRIEGAGGLPEPFRRARLFASTLEGRPIARLAEAFSATHLFLGPDEATPPPATQEEPGDQPRLSLVPVYEDAKNFRVFLLAKK